MGLRRYYVTLSRPSFLLIGCFCSWRLVIVVNREVWPAGAVRVCHVCNLQKINKLKSLYIPAPTQWTFLRFIVPSFKYAQRTSFRTLAAHVGSLTAASLLRLHPELASCRPCCFSSPEQFSLMWWFITACSAQPGVPGPEHCRGKRPWWQVTSFTFMVQLKSSSGFRKLKAAEIPDKFSPVNLNTNIQTHEREGKCIYVFLIKPKDLNIYVNVGFRCLYSRNSDFCAFISSILPTRFVLYFTDHPL